MSDELVKSFSALADPTRLAIVERLMAEGELPAGDIVAGVDITAPAISRHLKVLRDAGLIRQRAEGTKRIYSADARGLRRIADWTLSRRIYWDSQFDRLAAAIDLEGGPDA
ncbi:ArsR/SmtB family transcription factor [Chachezhania sediminis]|uniref:ArsR/SmtB family transcription factor n=1 Tax=Chachezhania sediminis TaxID=2599291 RepID=UPI00131D5C7A|nr:metalloregulator ArsR/SmtB family transcription factor [Chachezhania sediminis]